MPDSAGAPAIAPDQPLDVLRKPPLSSIIFFALVAIAGIVLAITRATRTIVVTCNGETMAQGDTCTTRSRRAVTSTEWTYDERLDYVTAQNTGTTAAGIAIAVFATVVIVFHLVRWMRDRTAAAQLAGQQAPLTSYAARTGVLTGLGSLAACALGAFGTALLGQAIGYTGAIVGVIGGVALLLGVALLIVCFPRGSTLVWAHPESVRVVTRSRIRDIAWQDMRYAVSFHDSPVRELTWKGKAPKLAIDDGNFFSVMRERINSAVRDALPARTAAGETLDFGKVTISGTTVTVDGTALDSAQIATVGKGRNQHGECLAFFDTTGKSLATVSELKVTNLDVLAALLTRR